MNNKAIIEIREDIEMLSCLTKAFGDRISNSDRLILCDEMEKELIQATVEKIFGFVDRLGSVCIKLGRHRLEVKMKRGDGKP